MAGTLMTSQEGKIRAQCIGIKHNLDLEEKICIDKNNYIPTARQT